MRTQALSIFALFLTFFFNQSIYASTDQFATCDPHGPISRIETILARVNVAEARGKVSKSFAQDSATRIKELAKQAKNQSKHCICEEATKTISTYSSFIGSPSVDDYAVISSAQYATPIVRQKLNDCSLSR